MFLSISMTKVSHRSTSILWLYLSAKTTIDETTIRRKIFTRKFPNPQHLNPLSNQWKNCAYTLFLSPFPQLSRVAGTHKTEKLLGNIQPFLQSCLGVSLKFVRSFYHMVVKTLRMPPRTRHTLECANCVLHAPPAFHATAFKDPPHASVSKFRSSTLLAHPGPTTSGPNRARTHEKIHI